MVYYHSWNMGNLILTEILLLTQNCPIVRAVGVLFILYYSWTFSAKRCREYLVLLFSKMSTLISALHKIRTSGRLRLAVFLCSLTHLNKTLSLFVVCVSHLVIVSFIVVFFVLNVYIKYTLSSLFVYSLYVVQESIFVLFFCFVCIYKTKCLLVVCVLTINSGYNCKIDRMEICIVT